MNLKNKKQLEVGLFSLLSLIFYSVIYGIIFISILLGLIIISQIFVKGCTNVSPCDVVIIGISFGYAMYCLRRLKDKNELKK